jgi:sugar phosphate permease
MPSFIGTKFQISEIQAGGFSMLYHHAAALIGVLIGGFLSDMIVPFRTTFRLQLQSAAMLLGVPLIFLMGQVDSLTNLWIVISLFGFVRGLYESNTHAAVFDVVPKQFRATVVGLMIMTGFLLGSLSPLLLGFLGDRYGTASGLGFGFSLLSIAWLVGGVCLLTALFVTFKKDRLTNST